MCTATRRPMRAISMARLLRRRVMNLNQVGHLTREFSRGS
jgi:hypothetical protein